MRKYLKETTSDWNTDYRVPCHTYIFNTPDTRVIGYIKEGTNVEEMFTKPQRFDKRGRTFEEVK